MSHPVPSSTAYAQYVQSMVNQYIQLAGASASLSAPLPKLVKPAALSDQPRIVILAPHPDDECLMAGVALRMQEEWSAKVSVIPFSYGSKIDRRGARAQELAEALNILGFELEDPRSNSEREKITNAEFLTSMKKLNPEILFSPHAKDLHPVHIEANQMVERYLANMSTKPIWIQTEYWQANTQPNQFIPLSAQHVIQIGEALMKHYGEISRNPYHLRLPAWYMDQARRAQEILPSVSGGGNSTQFIFGQLLQVV